MNPWRRPWIRSLARIVAATLGVGLITACVIRQPAWSRHPASPAVVSPADLEAHVRLLSEACFPRPAMAHENQRKALEYIAARLRAAGGRVELQPISTRAGRYHNVVAHFGPDAGSRYVVGAHFDSCGLTPGADDNASGVAGLLELARLLGREKSLPAHFELVAYNLEEPPYFAGPEMGSAVHARNLKAAQVPVALMLSLEMIGCFRDERGSQSYPMPLLKMLYPSRGNFIAIVGRWDQRDVVGRFKRACYGATPLPVVSIAAPSFIPAVDFSDHRNYWGEGYPALMITDTAFLRNPNYHQATDTPDTLDYRRMADVVVMVEAGLLEYAKR